jgi:16S rRNA (uracil1498-N3)-methyltransferase
MHRFYLPPEECHGNALHLTGGEAHHALHVLRVRQGERVVVLDGAGHEFLCQVHHVHGQDLRLSVIEKKAAAPLPCSITLLQAIPKGRLFESIIQKATELGATRIVPLLTERVVTKLDNEHATHKTEKWRQVAIEAIKQCGSPWLPLVDMPQTPAQFFLRGEKCDLPFVAALEGERRHPREYFHEFRTVHNRLPASACVWIGPEGDFTPAETNQIKGHGNLPITLGPLVLRTETAAAYCLSVLNYELQSPAG